MTAADRRLWLWTPVVAYLAFIFFLSSLSNTPQLPEGSDKNLHALLYAGLGVLLVRAQAAGIWRPVSWRMVVLTVIAAALYGVSDEFHQWFVPPRQVEAADVMADTIGAALAATVLRARSWWAHRI